MRTEHSAGAAVFTRTAEGVRWVVIQTAAGVWGFPKGHLESGETEEQAALREIREEVGLEVRLHQGFRAEERYALPGRQDTVKRVAFFLADYENQTPVPQPVEVAEVRLMSTEEALLAFCHESNKRVLRKASARLAEEDQAARVKQQTESDT